LRQGLGCSGDLGQGLGLGCEREHHQRPSRWQIR
jgi:hypothetical protein